MQHSDDKNLLSVYLEDNFVGKTPRRVPPELDFGAQACNVQSWAGARHLEDVCEGPFDGRNEVIAESRLLLVQPQSTVGNVPLRYARHSEMH